MQMQHLYYQSNREDRKAWPPKVVAVSAFAFFAITGTYAVSALDVLPTPEFRITPDSIPSTVATVTQQPLPVNSRQRISPTNDPITPKDTRTNSDRPDAEYGWGPFRTVDW